MLKTYLISSNMCLLVDRVKIEVTLDVTLEVTLIFYFSYGIKFYAAEFKFDFHGEWMGC